MDYTVNHEADRAVITLAGRLDVGAVPEVKSRIKQIAVQRTPFIVVDLSAVDFIDSSGLGGLVSCFKTVRERGGTLALVKVSKPVREALVLTYLDRVFEMFDSRESALSALDELAGKGAQGR